MPIQILVAPPASGKTQRCIDTIRELCESQPFLNIRVILRDRLQVRQFQRRLAAGGGAMGAQIGTFGDLYQALLLRAGQPFPLASDPLVYQVLRDIVGEGMAAGNLPHYAPIAGTPGFISILRDLIAELKRARVFPETLLEGNFQEEPALNELFKIYAAYQSRMRSVGWADAEGMNWLAVEALEGNQDLVKDLQLLIVDGFDSFNGAQLAAVKLMGEVVPQVLVTLPGTIPLDRLAHRRFARSLDRLTSMVPDAQLENIPYSVALPPALQHLEEGLFEAAPTKQSGEGQLTFIETYAPVDEAREALRWLKARMVRDGLHPNECALVIPAPERYRQFLQEAGAEFGLPLRFTQGELLTLSPGIVALLDLLRLPVQEWPRRLTLDTLYSPYFDLSTFGFSPADGAALELVSLFGPVIAGLEQWEESLTRLARRVEPAPPIEDDEFATPSLPVGAQAQALWESLTALATRLEPATWQSVSSWVHWLEDFLETLDFFGRAATDADRAAALELRETLRSLALREQVTGEAVIDLADFVTELNSALEGRFLPDHLPQNQPKVQVLQVLEARGLRYRAVALLGLSEGLLPQIEREDPFLNEEVRKELGLEPRLGRGQAGLFYQMVSRADQYLLLTRPTLADDGEGWQPSPYWRAVRDLFSDSIKPIRPYDPRPLAEAASGEELLALAIRRRSLPPAYAQFKSQFLLLRHGRTVLSARLAEEPTSQYEGLLASIAKTVENTFGPAYVWSPTRLETYNLCPYYFFVAHTLGVEAYEPPELGLAPHQLGSILHVILEKTYQQVSEAIPVEGLLEILQKVAQEVFATAPTTYGFRPTPLWEVEQKYYLDRLMKTVQALETLEAGWRPVAFEQSFGREGAPALLVGAGGQQIQLAGVIDRVDVNEGGKIRVIDYKTGSGHQGKPDLISGRRLQLPLYALAAQEALGLGEPAEGIYWAILAGKPGGLKLSRFEFETETETYRGPAGAVALSTEHVSQILQGVQAGLFAPQPPQGGCPDYCPAASWCWRYEPSFW